MIFVSMPIGSRVGWGTVGRNIALELAKITDVRLLTDTLNTSTVRDELDFRALHNLLPRTNDLGGSSTVTSGKLHAPLLTAVPSGDFRPMVTGLQGTRTVGYTVHEDTYVSPEALEFARRNYAHLAAGSTACEQRLRAAGLTNVSTILHGIDPTIFEPSPVERQYLRDSFVVFSGGKLELRKGQDVVVRAFKILQDKFRDVVLMTAWFNPFAATHQSMRTSELARFTWSGTDQATIAPHFLSENGIDLARTVILSPKLNFMMPRYYKQTDIGLFPSRCEGASNLVLMEYMACGKPAIATLSTGHKDILTTENSLPLTRLTAKSIERDGRQIAVWDEPDLDEVVATLEFAYHNRDRLRPIAQKAGEHLSRLTWAATARQFHTLLTNERAGP